MNSKVVGSFIGTAQEFAQGVLYNKVVRYWEANDIEEVCDRGYVRQVITLPDNSIMLGIQRLFDDVLLDAIHYYRLDDITLAIFEDDNE